MMKKFTILAVLGILVASEPTILRADDTATDFTASDNEEVPTTELRPEDEVVSPTEIRALIQKAGMTTTDDVVSTSQAAPARKISNTGKKSETRTHRVNRSPATN